MKKRKFLFILPMVGVLIISLVLSLKAGTEGEKDLTNSVENACSKRGSIYGTVVYFQSCYMSYMQAAQVQLKGKNTGIKKNVNTSSNGKFEFDDLKEDTYKLTVEKKNFKNSKATVKLKSGRAKFTEIELESKK
ncbi:MAG: hypothetical protein A2W17_07800 [Planctomycetes bacterium RBG_16_41_13]|nr:MAG: hypothetical protein A2W17_07800 [Planctomycetes bacterium RBG_16_41_13]